MYREPMHRLVYRNPMVRVLDVRIPAGDTTAYHVHDAPMVGVVVQDARIWSQAPGDAPGPPRTPPPSPSVFTNWTESLPYTHRVGDVDSVPLHYVVAEWVGRSGGEVPALPADDDRKLVEEGPTVRVYQITLEPHAATWAHTHVGPGLIVQATEGSLTDDGGPRARGGCGAGSWSWREGPLSSSAEERRIAEAHGLRDRLALIDPTILDYYERTPEETRLGGGTVQAGGGAHPRS